MFLKCNTRFEYFNDGHLDVKYLRTGPLCPVAPAQMDRMDTNRYCNIRNTKHYTENTPAGAYFADNLTH